MASRAIGQPGKGRYLLNYARDDDARDDERSMVEDTRQTLLFEDAGIGPRTSGSKER